MIRNHVRIFLFLIVAGMVSTVFAQGRPDPAKLKAEQQQAMKKLSFMDGVWRGTSTHTEPSGEKSQLIQTERIGPMLDGAVKVIEGRGYAADGKLIFNAFASLAFDVSTKTYQMNSHAQGNVGNFVLTPTANGFSWEIPAGPMVIRYTAEFKDGIWRQFGERTVAGKEPIRFFDMNLKRIADSDWPSAGAVAHK